MSEQDERLKASIKQEITSYTCEVCDRCASVMTDKILAKAKQHYEQKLPIEPLPFDPKFPEDFPKQKRLDRPDREKIADKYCSFCVRMNGACGDRIAQKPPCELCYIYADQILALFIPDTEPPRKLTEILAELAPDDSYKFYERVAKEIDALYLDIEEAKRQQQVEDTKYYAEMMKEATDRVAKEAKKQERVETGGYLEHCHLSSCETHRLISIHDIERLKSGQALKGEK